MAHLCGHRFMTFYNVGEKQAPRGDKGEEGIGRCEVLQLNHEKLAVGCQNVGAKVPDQWWLGSKILA